VPSGINGLALMRVGLSLALQLHKKALASHAI
jgi:hypothetical protein